MFSHYPARILALACLLQPCLEATPPPQSDGWVNMEPFVVTASLTERPLAMQPPSVQVLAEQDFEVLSADTMDEVLRFAPGLDLAPGGGTVLSPSIRGAGPRSSLILIDGRRIADGYRGLTDVRQIPTFMIERVEVVRGPVSSIYGSDALGGVVNIITKKTIDPGEALKTNGVLAFGDSNYQKGDAFGGFSTEHFTLTSSVSRHEQDASSGPSGISDQTDDVTLADIRANLTLHLAESHDLTCSLGKTDHERAGLRNGRVRDLRNDRYDLGLLYSGTTETDTSVHALFSLNTFDAEVMPPFSEEEEYLLVEGKAYASHPFTGALQGLAGVDFRTEERDDPTDGEPDNSYDNTGAFAQLEWRPGENWEVMAGLRGDWHSDFDNRASPRVQASYRITEHIALHAGYSEGYRSPTFYELDVGYYQNKRTQFFRNNPDLEAETSQSFEAGARGQIGRLIAGIVYYHLEIEDYIGAEFIETLPEGRRSVDLFQIRNLSSVTNQGVEAEAQLDLPQGLRLYGAITYLDSEDASTGESLPLEQEWKAVARANWQIPHTKLTANLSLSYHDEANDGAGKEIAAWWDLNGHVRYQLADDVEVYAGVENILDDSSSVFLARSRPLTYFLGARLNL